MDRSNEERNQHPETILPPVKRRPLHETDKHRNDRIAIPELVQATEIDPAGHQGSHQQCPDKTAGMGPLTWEKRACVIPDCAQPETPRMPLSVYTISLGRDRRLKRGITQ